MKKSANLFVLLSFLCTIFFVACKKDNVPDNGSTTGNEQMKTAATAATCTPVFAVNPFTTSTLPIDQQISLAGDWHNQYLSAHLSAAQAKNINYSHPDYDNHFRTTARSFFESRRMALTDNAYYACPDTRQVSDDLTAVRAGFSPAGVSVLDNVVKLINSFDVLSNNDFRTGMESLYAQSNALPDNERIPLKLMIRIALKSIDYWEVNLGKWEAFYQVPTRMNAGHTARALTNRQKLARIGLSDAIGAVKGAAGGIVGGPAGAVAGAIMVAGWDSCVRGVFMSVFGI